MLPGETILSGGPDICDGEDMFPHDPIGMEFEVFSSPAGFYIGTQCNYCGPFSRESDYYPSFEAAQSELDNGFIPR